MSPEESSPAQELVERKRDPSFDILKGILILCVVLLHSTGRSASHLAADHSTTWWVLKEINWSLCFAVPVFILASVVLWTRSQVARGNWTGYFGRRIKSILHPYLVWTVLYWLFKLFVAHTLLDKDSSLPLLTRLHLPARAYELLFGKAEFHLYFMFVMLQLAIIFPIIFTAFRAAKSQTFWVMCLTTLGIQYIVFAIYRSLYSPLYGLVVFRSPSSYVLWDITSLIPGLWLGLNWAKWPSVRRGAAIAGIVIALPLMVLIVSFEQALLHHADVSSYYYNGAISVLAMAMAFALLTVSQKVSQSKVGEWLAYVGQKSIQVYFVHPMIMFFMDGRRPTALFKALPLGPLWSFAVLVGLSLLFARAMEWLRLDGVLFGRAESKIKAPTTEEIRPSVAG